MSEYIVRETGSPGTVKQEIVGELVRCKDCKHADEYNHCSLVTWWNKADDFCSMAEQKQL